MTDKEQVAAMFGPYVASFAEELVEVNGEFCVSPKVFARMVRRSLSYVYQMTRIGNGIRPVEVYHISPTSVAIPVREFFNFPFPLRGRYGVQNARYFDKNGACARLEPEAL